jgi:hypothetical protein
VLLVFPLYIWAVLSAIVVPIAVVAIAIDVRAIRRGFEHEGDSHSRP